MSEIIELFEKLNSIGAELQEISPRLTRSNSREAASLLNDLLHLLEAENVPESTMTNANIHVVIMPLLTIYKSMMNNEKSGYQVVMEPWLKILHFLLSKTLIKVSMPPNFTKELMVLFITIMDQSSSPSNIPNTSLSSSTSEEIKHLALKCFSAALPTKYKEGRFGIHSDTVANTELTNAIQQNSFIIFASQAIMALLNTIRLGQNLQFRLDAIQVLSQLLHDNIQNIDKLADLLPGIISKLCSTFTQKSENANHQITCSLLDAIGQLIQAVMRDDMNDTLVEITNFQDIVNQHSRSEEQQETTKRLRNKQWYAKVKSQLRLMLGQILQLRLYPDWRTRLAFVEFSYKLLSTCSRTLDNCVQLLLDILVLHADDAYSQVSITCRAYMQALLSISSFGNAILPILKDNLYEWIMKFPQYVISKDEQEKTIAMSLITGMIMMLDDQAESVLSIVLSRASDGWMTALEIDKNSLDILEEKSSKGFIELGVEGDNNDKRAATPLYPRIRFKHIVTDMSTTKLNRLLNIIGQHCDLSSWVHHFMRYVSIDSQELNDPQAAYIVHALLSGYFSSNSISVDSTEEWIVSDDDDDDNTDRDKKLQLENIAAQVLHDIINILSEAATTNTTSNSLATVNLDDESGHVLTVCFGLQIVGLAAYILEQDYLQEQLITILYPLLAHLGSSNVYIHTYALITLDAISLECGLDGAKELVIQNIDYIINSISQHISILTSNARVPLVLKALIHVGGYSSINYLDDTIEEIYGALERYSLNDWLCTQLCGVLFEVIQTLEKNIPSTTGSDDTRSKENTVTEMLDGNDATRISPEILSFIQQKDDFVNEEYKSMEDIGKYFLDRQNKGLHDDLTLDQIMEQGNLPMDISSKDDDDDDNQYKQRVEDDKALPLTHEQQMAKEIMDKSSHFLTVSSPKLRSQILLLLTSGVGILSDHPQELNQLVHSMWSSIVNRFNDSENYVVLHAASLVEKVSQVSTDFLSRKFTVDLWPKFKLLLQKGVSAAQSDPSSTGYSVYSLYHRTQLCLLNTLTRIAYHVPMNQDSIKDILETTRYYYKNEQVNQQLDQACQDLFKGLSTQQADTVWLYQQHHNSPLIPPNSSLLDAFQVPEWMSCILTCNNRRAGTLVQFK